MKNSEKNGEKIFRALSGIDEELLERSEAAGRAVSGQPDGEHGAEQEMMGRNKKPLWTYWKAAAACLGLVAAGALLSSMELLPDRSKMMEDIAKNEAAPQAPAEAAGVEEAILEEAILDEAILEDTEEYKAELPELHFPENVEEIVICGVLAEGWYQKEMTLDEVAAVWGVKADDFAVEGLALLEQYSLEASAVYDKQGKVRKMIVSGTEKEYEENDFQIIYYENGEPEQDFIMPKEDYSDVWGNQVKAMQKQDVAEADRWHYQAVFQKEQEKTEPIGVFVRSSGSGTEGKERAHDLMVRIVSWTLRDSTQLSLSRLEEEVTERGENG